MNRQTLPAVAAEPDAPARTEEIRVPARSGRHEARAERQARA